MTGQLVTRGSWPGAVTLTRGWARAEARPWNDDTGPGHLRLVRGGADFLEAAAHFVHGVAGADIYSPALYPSGTRVWRRAGFETAGRLAVMERPAAVEVPAARRRLTPEARPDWEALAEIDALAFEPFWRMGRAGLEEAVGATSGSALFVAVDGTDPVGYVIAGAQMGMGFVQRIAVRGDRQGQGAGTDLLRAALSWCRWAGAHRILLNVRDETSRAVRLYRAHGFEYSGSSLEILRRTGSEG